MMKKRSASSKTPTGKRVKAEVKKAIERSCEAKYQERTYTPGTLTTATWTWYGLLNNSTTGIPQGTSASERIGNKIKVKEILINITVQPSGSHDNVMSNGSICRVMVLKDKNWRQTAYGSVASTTYLQADALSALPNWPNKENYHVYGDFQHAMNITSTLGDGGTGIIVSSTSGPAHVYQLRYVPNTVVEYSGAAGTADQILTNQFWIGICSDAANCCNVPSIRINVIYTDC